MAELDEFIVTAPGGEQQAFAPYAPDVWLPPTVRAPGVPGSALVGTTATTFGSGLLALLFPMNSGPPGTGDAPDDPSTISNRYGKPPPPPPIETTFEDFQPPNWEDIAAEPFRQLPSPKDMPDFGRWLRTGARAYDLLQNLFPPQPEALPEFVVTPPPVTARPGVEVPFLDLVPKFTDAYGYAPDFAPGPGPGPAPAPGSAPGYDPLPGDPFLSPVSRPGTRTQPRPTVDPSPYVSSSPLPDIIGRPIGDPAPAPNVSASPRPSDAGPRTTTVPDFLTPGDFIVDPRLRADPLELLQFGPQRITPKKDACECEKKKPKQKDKKPKERTVCYRGTYRQLRKGIVYKQLEQVPCEAKPQAKRSRKPKLKPGQFPGLSLTGGQWVDLGTQAISEFAPIILDWLNERDRKKTKPKKEPKPKKARPRRGKKTISPVPRRPGGFETVFF